MPDNMLVNIAVENAWVLGVLSSRIHVTWVPNAGGTLENEPRYNKTRCFDTFPFMNLDGKEEQTLAQLAEELDLHRKRVLNEHKGLTLTSLYNVLEKLQQNVVLTTKEQDINERGLVSILKFLHEEIDAAVANAYGWPLALPDQEILARIVALNEERRAEESRNIVRWLRPDHQAPAGTKITVGEQGELKVEAVPSAATTKSRKARLPKALAERIGTVRSVLSEQEKPVHLEELSRCFQSNPKAQVQEVLNALVALGLARRIDGNRYTP